MSHMKVVRQETRSTTKATDDEKQDEDNNSNDFEL